MLKNREVILVGMETTYQVDPGLAAANDAVQVVNPSWAYSGARMHERGIVKANLGPRKPIFGGTLQQVSFECEVKGSGSAGVAPEFGPLLRACGFGETIVGGTSVTYAPVSTAFESVVIYYYQDGQLFVLTGCRGNVTVNGEAGMPLKATFTLTGHTKMRGTAQAGAATTITLPTTYSTIDDTYNSRVLKITRGTGAGQTRTITDYIGATRIATVATWTTNPDATSVFEIDGGPIDVALITPTYDSNVPVPYIAAPFSIDSYAAVIAKLAFDMGNTVATPPDVGSPNGYGPIQITQRNVTGSFDPEAVLVATHDFHGRWKGGNAMALATGVIGDTAGNRVAVTMPALTYNNPPSKADRDAISTYEMAFMAAESAGNDQVSMAFT